MNYDVKHLAWLARIEIRDDEIEKYKKHVNKMIEYLNMLDEIEPDIEPYHISSKIDRFREDRVRESSDDIFSIIINKKDRFVKAPKMI
ncbi:MAG: Asp-tRNA(Asn)/Glu-tRNA(Gln) amidotransferase subunit GatC [Candidatus Nitrosocaldaceae archaeon]